MNLERVVAQRHLAKRLANYSHCHCAQKNLSLVMCEDLIPFRARTSAPVTFSPAKSSPNLRPTTSAAAAARCGLAEPRVSSDTQRLR